MYYPCAFIAQGFFVTFIRKEIYGMETRIALIGIIVESKEAIEKLNTILSEYSQYIIGRMGLPYQKKNVSIISIVMDAPNDVISALSGKLGMLPHISAKTVYSKLP
jgi:putative iron-only hydrogenase system regulator